jgi:hypothetical protein
MPVRIEGMKYKVDDQKRISLNLGRADMELMLEFPGLSMTKKIEWAIRKAAEAVAKEKADGK